MLYIKLKNENGYWSETRYCDIGLRSSDLHFNKIAEEVIYITADGKELKHILSLFGYSYEYKHPCTIPYAEFNNSMTWYGDIAKTILANL